MKNTDNLCYSILHFHIIMGCNASHVFFIVATLFTEVVFNRAATSIQFAWYFFIKSLIRNKIYHLDTRLLVNYRCLQSKYFLNSSWFVLLCNDWQWSVVDTSLIIERHGSILTLLKFDTDMDSTKNLSHTRIWLI